MQYHNAEELLIAFICLYLSIKTYTTYRKHLEPELKINHDILSRIYLTSTGFFLLFLNSVMHALIHIFNLSTNLLFHTLFGYSAGLLLLISSVSFRNPSGKKMLPIILYIPFVIILFPWIHPVLPPFTEFRPLMWVLVTYLSGTLFILYIALFQNTKLRSYLHISFGFLLIAVSGTFLYFPSSIGAKPWVYGHLVRPVGFVVLLLSIKEENLVNLKGSILYRALIAFSLLAAIPLLFFGVAILYEEINPLGITGRRFLIFILLLSTLVAALIFGIGTVIRLIKPIIELQRGVNSLSKDGFERDLKINTGDEIEDLTNAFNKMLHELKSSIKEQERLGRLAAMGELSARLAHEIRNPLNAISGASSYINKNYKGELITGFIRIIKEEVGRINLLTTSLLNFSKPVHPQPVLSDINGLINETIALISPEFNEKGVSIETVYDNSISSVLIDKNQIKQVIINLLLNALDASEKGDKVIISTRRVNSTVVLSVKDFGTGIGEEEIKDIFRPFYTTKTKGTGLGLAIAEKIIKEHRGHIKAESRLGEGSIFSLYIPLKNETFHISS